MNKPDNKLIKGYEKITGQLHDLLPEGDQRSEDWLTQTMHKVQDEAIALKELTRAEAAQVSGWLQRDLHAIANFISETKQEIKDWLPIEIEAEENYLYNQLISVADQTTVELLKLKEQTDLAAFEIWHTGEVTGPGILQCGECGEKIHFKKTGHIPPCPRCHKTTFARIADDLKKTDS